MGTEWQTSRSFETCRCKSATKRIETCTPPDCESAHVTDPGVHLSQIHTSTIIEHF
jgi:hypothetical protein